jgi:creatinine amidohydrolase
MSDTPFGRWELMRPDDLEAVLAEAPIAYVPLGTFEHHGWHLPVCFDADKAHALCLHTAERTGGAVLPSFYYGTGGGHSQFKWSIIAPEDEVRPLIERTLDRLSAFGFRVVVILTGHYPGEQVRLVKALAEEAERRNPATRYLGLAEVEVSTPEPGDAVAGDHAATYETSLALALDPEWVSLDDLRPGRDPAQVALPDSPRGDHDALDPASALYAIGGRDPRVHASPHIGARLVEEIVTRLAAQVETALS